MIATAVALLGPAIGRINFGIRDLETAILFAFGVSNLFLIALIIFERFKGRRYKPYIISLGICVLFQSLFPWIPESQAWQIIAAGFIKNY
jgi:hypothetical protein